MEVGTDALPHLRSDLGIFPGPTAGDGSPSITIQDRVRQKFFRLGWPELEMLKRWSLGSASKVAELIRRETTLHIDPADVAAFGIFLRSNELVDAVGQGAIDLAIVWGPFGGYFAKPYGKALTVELAPKDPLLEDMPFAYDISMGVRKEDTALAEKLNNSLQRRQGEIARILGEYRVPLIPLPSH